MPAVRRATNPAQRPLDDPDDALPRAARAAQRDGPVGALVELPDGDPLPDVRQVRVLRDPQRRRPVRLVAAVQVPDPRPGCGALPGRGPRPRHPDLPAGPRPVHAVVRRPPASSSRTAWSCAMARTSSCSPRPSRTWPTSRSSSAGSTSGSRRSPTTGRCCPSRARAPATLLASLAPAMAELPYFGLTTTSIARVPVHVSRTGFTGDLGYEVWVPAVRRPDRVRRGLGRQPRAGDHPDRDDRAVHGPDRGRSRPARRRLPLEPLRLDRCRPDHADRAGSRLDVPRPGDRRPDVHRPATRSGASCATRRRAGS